MKYEIGDQVTVKGLTGTFHVMNQVGLDDTMVLLLYDSSTPLYGPFGGGNTFSGSAADKELKRYTSTWMADMNNAGGNASVMVISIPSKEELQTVRTFYGFTSDSDHDTIDWLRMEENTFMYTKTPASGPRNVYIYTYRTFQGEDGSYNAFDSAYTPMYVSGGYIRPTLYLHESNLTKVA